MTRYTANGLPYAEPRKREIGWSPNGVPLVPMYERGDIGGEYLRRKNK